VIAAVFFTFAVIAIVYASVRVVFGPRPVLVVEDETNDDLAIIHEAVRRGERIQGEAGAIHTGCLEAYQASDFDHCHAECFDAIGRAA